MAMTADGKIATANRAIATFGSRRDQRHLLELRATADAVMAGARTVDLTRINLGPGPAHYRRLRRKRGLAEYNLRIVVSGSGSVNPAAEVFRHRFSPIIVLTSRRAPARAKKKLARMAEVKAFGTTEINFKAALRWLRRKWKVKRLLCEGGGEVNDALLRQGLIDELHLTVCPRVVGGEKAPTIVDGEGLGSLAKAGKFELQSAQRHGDEMFFVFAAKRLKAE